MHFYFKAALCQCAPADKPYGTVFHGRFASFPENRGQDIRSDRPTSPRGVLAYDAVRLHQRHRREMPVSARPMSTSVEMTAGGRLDGAAVTKMQASPCWPMYQLAAVFGISSIPAPSPVAASRPRGLQFGRYVWTFQCDEGGSRRQGASSLSALSLAPKILWTDGPRLAFSAANPQKIAFLMTQCLTAGVHVHDFSRLGARSKFDRGS